MNIELRDYFAAKAMSAYFTDTSVAFDKNTIERGSKVAYVLADAMLAAREAGKQKPDGDGWIDWHGGECPVDDTIFVEAKTRGYGTQAKRKAGLFRWDRRLNAGDIIAYRVVQP